MTLGVVWVALDWEVSSAGYAVPTDQNTYDESGLLVLPTLLAHH